MRALLAGLIMFCSAAPAVVLDRIALTVGNQPIKQSDIEREIRVTSFINGDPVEFTTDARRKAANRLIDQALIRVETQLAQYPEAKREDVEKLVEQLRGKRFGSAAGFAAALKRYGVTEEQLRRHLAWQVTVLNFIEQRFRPGVLVSDEEVEKYFQANRGSFRQAASGPPVTAESARDQIVEQIAGERVNRDFFTWLEQSRGRATVRYREAELK